MTDDNFDHRFSMPESQVRTGASDDQVRSKAELVSELRRIGGTANLALANRVNESNPSTWPDPRGHYPA